MNKTYPVKKKIEGLSYSITMQGIELPVLDITHPLFISSIDEIKLKEILRKTEGNVDKTADKFNNMPGFLKKFLSNRSFIMAELFRKDGDSAFLTGISTLMLKLGPGLIGRGRKRFLDRLSSRGIGGIVLRMRVRDISNCMAEAIIQLLTEHPAKDLCFINIAGGAASDTINSIFLVQQTKPDLLKNRKIEINVLDIDTAGPAFAERCIEALKEPGGRFRDMNISIRYINYDWNKTENLKHLLSERKEWLQICSSEGGLFEYCNDDILMDNLNTIYSNSNAEIVIAGSLMHDIETVDSGAVAALKISTSIKPRFLGLDGLKRLTEESKWKLDRTIEGNPRYAVFRLKKVSE